MTGGAMQGVEEEVLEPCQRRVGRLSRREICHEVPQILGSRRTTAPVTRASASGPPALTAAR